jgi:hypothetical protein
MEDSAAAVLAACVADALATCFFYSFTSLLFGDAFCYAFCADHGEVQRRLSTYS